MSNQIIYECEDRVEGIYTAIYQAWKVGSSQASVEIRGLKTMSLFSDYVSVKTDYEIAVRVAESIKKKLSLEIYEYVYQAALSESPEKGQFIFEFLEKAFKTGPDIINALHNQAVLRVFELSRKVGREVHKYLGFVRFEELEKNILVSRINPVSNAVPMLADHFSDRLHNENWIILDVNRELAAIHKSGVGFLLSYGITEQNLDQFGKKSSREEQFRKLWSRFSNTISIKERQNLKLQQQMMPLRYRKYM